MGALSNLFRPALDSVADARRAVLRGFWVMMISLALSLGYGLLQELLAVGAGAEQRVCSYFLYGLECSYAPRNRHEALASLIVAFYDHGITLLLALGIYQASRFVSLVAFFMTLFYALVTLPAQLSGLAIVTIPALLLLWQAVRGVFVLAHLRELDDHLSDYASGV